MPTKTEAADLNIAMFGRHGEAPLPIVAAYSPTHCFFAAIEAARIALKYRTPVILLSDGFLANGSEPWRLPDIADLPDIRVPFATEANATDDDGTAVFHPYLRDPATLARPWAIPGTPGLMHRIGGLEKEDVTGNISYEPENHEHMVRLQGRQGRPHRRRAAAHRRARRRRRRRVRARLGFHMGGDRRRPATSRRDGNKVAWVHLTHLNPLPNDLGDDPALGSVEVIVPELNMGQLTRIVRAEYLVDARRSPRCRGSRSRHRRSRTPSTSP